MPPNQTFWTMFLLVALAVGLIWCLLGAFSMLLGYSIVYATDPTPYTGSIHTPIQDFLSLRFDEEADYVPHRYYYVIRKASDGFFSSATSCIGSSSMYYWGQFPAEENWFADSNTETCPPNTDYYLLAYATGYLETPDWYIPLHKGADRHYWTIGEAPPLEARVWGIDPVSETQITDLDTPFEFGWEGLDDWDTLWVNFQNRPTGIFTEGQEILITTSPSGSAVFNLEDFNFDRYGTFYFHAVAGRDVPEVIEGMFFTGKYTSEWTDDLVDPEYNLILTTTTGLAPVFEMSDFEEWYGTHAKFTEPTDMFLSIVGFFNPIFNKIGEFGNRIKDYFNVNEAYSQGYEIGKAIPYFTYFTAQTSSFFGGFPVMKWFFVLILLLTGIFIFRLIMKFIPFLGN